MAYRQEITTDFTASNINLGILPHPTLPYLYFISQFQNAPSDSYYAGVVKTNYDLTVEASRGFLCDPNDEFYTVGGLGEHLYITANNNFFLEIQTTDLALNRYISVDGANLRVNGAPKAYANKIFFRLLVGGNTGDAAI